VISPNSRRLDDFPIVASRLAPLIDINDRPIIEISAERRVDAAVPEIAAPLVSQRAESYGLSMVAPAARVAAASALTTSGHLDRQEMIWSG
jgi:hypothetical protein